MRFLASAAVVVGLALFCHVAAEDEVEEGHGDSKYWSYSGAAGPYNWYTNYPICNGQKQSPIDIDPAHAIYSGYLDQQPIKLLRYDEPLGGNQQGRLEVYAKNNGHTITVRIGDPSKHEAGMVSGGLPSQYVLGQFHFHWGSTNDKGSEHTYGGKSYPMELHLVHFNRVYLGDTAAIENNKDGIAVLGIFIEVGDENPAFDPIISVLADTSKPGATEVPIELDSMENFLPKDITKFYRYEGSLTTPPCLEAVIWTVLKEPIQISQQQLDAFRSQLKIDKTDSRTPTAANLINDNFRPVMPLGDRQVFVSYPDDTSGVIDVEDDHLMNWGYYDGHGLAPENWGEAFAQCKGKKQSPIHIRHSETVASPELSQSPFKLNNYDTLPENVDVLLENNGHTVVVGLGDGIGVTGGSLPGPYRLAQFHIHWGSHNANGSEHMLDGKQYPAEIHFVHTNMLYGGGKNFDQIQANHDGLAVLGVMIDVGAHNPAFDALINSLPQVKHSSATNRVKLVLGSLRGMLPDDMSEFYRYTGSLTTPPCSEIVVWTLFRKPIYISQSQLNALRSQLLSTPDPEDPAVSSLGPTTKPPSDGGSDTDDHSSSKPKRILDNFRPVQEIGFRVVRFAKIEPQPEGGNPNVINDDSPNVAGAMRFSVPLCTLILVLTAVWNSLR